MSEADQGLESGTEAGQPTRRKWVRVCSLRDLEPGRGVAALVEGQQVALFLLPGAAGEPASRLHAIDNLDPVTGAQVLSRGLLGSAGDVFYVASPMLKHRFDLESGRCLDGTSPGVRVWPVRVWGRTVEVLAWGEPSPQAAASSPSGVATHCPFCALQCGMTLAVAGTARTVGTPAMAGASVGEPSGSSLVEVVADPSFPLNEGRMCVKGWASVGLLRAPDRILQPLVRNGSGQLRSATWDAALDELASQLGAARETHGPEAVGVFGSGALTNEKAYLLGKFARVALGTPHVDYNGRYCMSSAAAAANRAFGIDRGLPFPVADLAETDTLVLWGANPADTMPPLMTWVERRRGRLVVVDPRRTATAKVADLHLQPVPGSDMAVALGLLHLSWSTGVVDEDYLRRRTVGWEEVRESLEGWTPDRVERLSGLAPGELQALLDALAGPPSAILLTGRGPEQQSKGADTVNALINLMLALGRMGRPASGYGCLTGQANGQGGREHGQKADQLPGYRSINDPAARAHVADVWGVPAGELPGPGRSAVEMLSSIGEGGGIRALLVVGSDVASASPDAGAVTARLRSLDTLAVLDCYMTDTAEVAGFVLPVTLWAEEEGTLTSPEGRVLRRRRAVAPPSGVRDDLEVLCALAARLGHGEQFSFAGAEQVFDELCRASAGGPADYSGITYERLDAPGARSGPGIAWPCPSPDHPGTPRLFASEFAFPDGRARMVPVHWRPPAESPDAEFPVWFTTGRLREHYNTGGQTRRIPSLVERAPEPFLQVHPLLARRVGCADGEPVLAESRRGRARFRCRVSADIRPDTVFAPFHWGGETCANLLTSPALDPVSRMPEFKVCAVRLVAGD